VSSSKTAASARPIKASTMDSRCSRPPDSSLPGAPGSRCDLDSMSGHHPIRMSPGASAPRLRTWVVMRGFRRRARRRSGSGGPGDSLGRQFLDAAVGRAPARRRGFPAESCSRCPQARSPRSGRGCAARGGTRAATAQIMRIDRRRITRSVAKLARTRRACGANPLAGFGSEASKDQHYVLDAAHTQRKG
jgi:hypothetical protein